MWPFAEYTGQLNRFALCGHLLNGGVNQDIDIDTFRVRIIVTRCDVPSGNCSVSTAIAQCTALLTHSTLFVMTGHSRFQSEFSAQCDLMLSVCLSVSCNLQLFVVSLRSSSSCQCFIPRLCILSSIFPSIMCFRRQFLRLLLPIQLTFLLFIDLRYSPPSSGVARNFFRRGCSTNSVEDRGQRERGSVGGSPLVRGSGGSYNLVQEISFHIVKVF
jgi:hypothetical protein